MANENSVTIGKVIPTFKGDWNANTSYSALDVVVHKNITYVAETDILTGTEPKEGTGEWSIMARGAIGPQGPQGERGKQVFKSSSEYYDQNSLGHWWSDLTPAVSGDNPPKIGDTIITSSGDVFQINAVNVGDGGGGGGTFGVGGLLGNIKGPQGPKGDTGDQGPKGDMDLSQIKVGGRNLILNSRLLTIKTAPNAYATIEVVPYDSKTNMWHITAPQGGSINAGLYFSQYGNITSLLAPGTNWVFSFDIKGTGIYSQSGIEWSEKYNGPTGPVSSDWTRISSTGSSKGDAKPVILYFNTSKSPLDVYIKLPKLEIGNVPTDWSPAPEYDTEPFNLLHNTEFENNLSGWNTVNNGGNATISAFSAGSPVNGHQYVRISAGTTALTDNAYFEQVVTGITSAPYTFSFYGWASVSNKSGAGAWIVEVNSTGGETTSTFIDFGESTSWTKYYLTFTPSSTTTSLKIRFKLNRNKSNIAVGFATPQLEPSSAPSAYVRGSDMQVVPDDSNIVHKTGTETVDGDKKFTGNINFSGGTNIVSATARGQILDGYDLNGYTDPYKYVINGAKNLVNYPSGASAWATLEVENINDKTATQTLKDSNSQVFIRSRSGSAATWSAWRNVSDPGDPWQVVATAHFEGSQIRSTSAGSISFYKFGKMVMVDLHQETADFTTSIDTSLNNSINIVVDSGTIPPRIRTEWLAIPTVTNKTGTGADAQFTASNAIRMRAIDGPLGTGNYLRFGNVMYITSQ